MGSDCSQGICHRASGLEWERSRINVPSPGTIAGYRKGQYHAHETTTEWRVHLDNYDPKHHPVLHLIDDAPLLLMIGDTFVTLIAGMRKRTGDKDAILDGQTKAWQDQVFVGLFIILVRLFVITNPWLSDMVQPVTMREVNHIKR